MTKILNILLNSYQQLNIGRTVVENPKTILLNEMRKLLGQAYNPYVAKLEDHCDIILTNLEDGTNCLNDCLDSSRPLIVDLGCGAGNFLRDYSMVSPECDFIGFELRFKRLVKGAAKFKKRDIKNIRLIRARAEDIGFWLPDDSVSEVHINFPDPWPKRRHQKHRLLTSQYLKLLHMKLKKGGNLIFKTDHQDYFLSVMEMIEQQSLLKLVEYSDDLHNSAYREQNIATEFEMLFKGQGCPVYYLKTVVQGK